MDRPYDETLAHVRTASKPSELKITDIRFAEITAASMHCILVKIYTNQGLVGMGEVRDGFRRRLIASTRRFEKTPRHLKENAEAF